MVLIPTSFFAAAEHVVRHSTTHQSYVRRSVSLVEHVATARARQIDCESLGVQILEEVEIMHVIDDDIADLGVMAGNVSVSQIESEISKLIREPEV